MFYNIPNFPLMISRCVPADAVALMRRAVYHGDGLTDNGADSSQTLFRVDFDAFAFIGPSKKLFISCALCLNHCEMVCDINLFMQMLP